MSAFEVYFVTIYIVQNSVLLLKYISDEQMMLVCLSVLDVFFSVLSSFKVIIKGKFDLNSIWPHFIPCKKNLYVGLIYRLNR